MFTTITISNGAAARIASGELWFSESDCIGRKPRMPAIVQLVDRRHKIHGMALLSPDSRYYLRIFSNRDEDVNKEFWRARILNAHKRRAKLFPITDAYRIVNGESDGIPTVVIERYNDIYSLQIQSSGAELIKQDICDIIREEFSPRAIVLKGGSGLKGDPSLQSKDGILFGDLSSAVIREGAQNFAVDLVTGQKSGAFLDYRAFRLKGRELARGRSLDGFCYQGWFACQIADRAERVIAIDSSKGAIAAAKRNGEINSKDNIDFVTADLFDWLRSSSERFDFIHLDPPSFAKGGASRDAAVRGYRKLIADALPLLNSGGIFFISSCAHAITERILEETTVDMISKTHRSCDVIYRGIQDCDHPVIKGHAPSLYLKAIALKVGQK